MAKKKNPPCVRDLTPFRKSGCPQKHWDGEEGCPLWMELTTTTRDDPVPKLRKMCVDVWMFDLKISELGLLEGNQQATESFRNGMLDTSDPSNIKPKPDPATVALVNILYEEKEKRELIEKHEMRKQLEKKEQNENSE